MPPNRQGRSQAIPPSKWDIFAGYSYLAPHGTVQPTAPTASNSANYDASIGRIVSVARYFNKYVGVQLEADEHIPNQNQYYRNCPSCGSTWRRDDFSAVAAA